MKRALGSLIILIVTIALLEGALQVVSMGSKTVRGLLSSEGLAPTVPDPVLGMRLNPDIPGHDKAGFRNASAVESASFVALGDSQTYGTGVSREESWPHQLAVLSGKPVYNMGVPGYGPIQELILMSRAMTLRPQWVVEAFYSGNDLYDAYHMVYTKKQLTDLRSGDQSVIGTIEKAETESPLEQTFERLYQAYSGNFDFDGTADKHRRSYSARTFLSEHSMLWGMLRAARRAVTKQEVRTVSPDALWSEQVSVAQKSRGLWVAFEKRGIRTVFVPQYRLSGLNLKDSRIHEGLRVSIRAIRRMAGITQKTGVRFTVVLIPTKSLVFFETFGGASEEALLTITELAQNERMMWTELKNELRLSGILYIDMLPVLCKTLSGGESPYPITTDGHPNANGHKAIAAAVLSAITTNSP